MDAETTQLPEEEQKSLMEYLFCGKEYLGRHSGEVTEGEPVDEPDADDQPRERHLGGKMRGRN